MTPTRSGRLSTLGLSSRITLLRGSPSGISSCPRRGLRRRRSKGLGGMVLRSSGLDGWWHSPRRCESQFLNTLSTAIFDPGYNVCLSSLTETGVESAGHHAGVFSENLISRPPVASHLCRFTRTNVVVGCYCRCQDRGYFETSVGYGWNRRTSFKNSFFHFALLLTTAPMKSLSPSWPFLHYPISSSYTPKDKAVQSQHKPIVHPRVPNLPNIKSTLHLPNPTYLSSPHPTLLT